MNMGVDIEPVMIAAGSVPESAIDPATSQIKSPWGGDVNVIWCHDCCTEGTGLQRMYFIHLNNTPREICSRVISLNQGGMGSFTDDLAAVTLASPRLNPTTIKYQAVTERYVNGCLGPGDWPIVSEITPAQAGQACATLDPEDNIVFFLMILN
jgi:hypothetical protein